MTDRSCSNVFCLDRDAQLRFYRNREQLLTTFNEILIDRIRFLEQTLNKLSSNSFSVNNFQQQIRRSSSATSFLNEKKIRDSSSNIEISENLFVSSTVDLTAKNDKGRLEARRFACDLDDNELRAFKAMIFTEQARKQQTPRPLHRLRQVLKINNSNPTTLQQIKK